MSADLLITALVLDEEGEPDLAAAGRAIARLGPSDIEEPVMFDADPDEPAGLQAIREDLREALGELREALEYRIDVALLYVRGAVVIVTGGMSHGDTPTEAGEAITRLRAVRGVLTAAGFENES